MSALRCYVTRFIQQSHWKKINRKEKIKMNKIASGVRKGADQA